ncbi:hypothetical protein [uncultured Victivallis sp.]|uniref:helix-turn-helix transcriptional regulator n=1 Tax=uncultured Victivallis sp. TaxID=354118 RepID=UPI002589E003|nr:hypothetical protein [uncultured Victivallis sp.]
MKNAKDKLLELVVTGNLSDEVLSNALALLLAKEMPGENPTGFISEKEARKFCGNVSRSTFWHWQKRGLPSYLIGGRRLFLPDELKAFVLGYQNRSDEKEEK